MKSEKKIGLVLAGFIISLIFSSEIMAQDKLYYMGGYLSYSMESIDSDAISNEFLQPVNVDFSSSLGIQARGGMEIKEFLFGEAMIEYLSPFEDSSDNKTAEVSVINAGVNCKAILTFWNRLEPYATAGLGLMYAKKDISFQDQSSSDTNFGMNARLGAGLNILLSPELFLGFETAYVMGVGGTSYVKYINLSLGMCYRF
ncbi:Outer membrane protein beta-barrel domain-containing protein [Desulfonema limicola]|uniref:Outer membrane protein beta-barrel domain-containing protein n=1 Tax=Desulfonema limicola TaxID=45656 RepID=A0A975B9H0_9BACT|nr:porin family protein [Desulfonema limicola]QTA81204.1 Outer membrane protein beta-barrel domain-containing protein [Desulfonema limicola]